MFHVCGVKRCFIFIILSGVCAVAKCLWKTLVFYIIMCCILYVYLYVLCLYVEVGSLLDLRFSPGNRFFLTVGRCFPVKTGFYSPCDCVGSVDRFIRL